MTKLQDGRIQCDECGRIGEVTEPYVDRTVTSGVSGMDLVIGLDLEGCEGCRKAVGEWGFFRIEIGPDGTVKAIPDEPEA